MQDQNTKTTNPINPAVANDASSALSKANSAAKAAEKAAEKVGNSATPKPTTPAPTKPAPKLEPKKPQAVGLPSNDFVKQIAEKVRNSENILVALSRDPSVDELAAAIGLTIFLDGMQKHTTAIYSGQAPDALKFLQPEGTFETNTDSLQDFIIALSKEKADHLRYKLDGDFVKVFITPYKTTITQEDLEFSYGDYNVDLVLALGVPTADDLDGALSEHGRIMHDATTVDITCDAPGKFAEIEWSDPGVSSVSEMVTKLIFELQPDPNEPLDKEIATALLTGIVASTERFSNGRTSADTMQLASRLMAMGADQQLIATHVMDNDPGIVNMQNEEAPSPTIDNSNLLVGQDYASYQSPESKETVVAPQVPQTPLEQSVAMAQIPTINNEPEPVSSNPTSEALNDAVSSAVANVSAAGATGIGIQPRVQSVVAPQPEEPKDYAKMLEQALTEPGLPNNSDLVPNIQSAMPAGVGVVTTDGPADMAQPDVTSADANPAGASLAGSSDSVPMNATPSGDSGEFANQASNGSVNPASSDFVNPAASATPAEPVGEPVAHQAVVLPPPPTPEVGPDMMPPVLPNVQMLPTA